MVAGDTKKIIVIKNISSNLIEEAILILKNEPGASVDGQPETQVQSSLSSRNGFILKEAESIINQYIKENGLAVKGKRRCRAGLKLFRFSISVNALINCLLVAALAFLILVVCKAI